MATLPELIISLLTKSSGMTDREITSHLRGTSAPQQPINIAARNLEKRGVVVRKKRNDGLIGNYLTGQPIPLRINTAARSANKNEENQLSEDKAKALLDKWLQADGWTTEIAWGRQRGIDIDAHKGNKRWVVEVKGIGSRPEMRVNYFIGMLGETLQRMDDPNAKYSIAVPNVQQFRNLWARLPLLAKQRTTISMLLVSENGAIEEVLE